MHNPMRRSFLLTPRDRDAGSSLARANARRLSTDGRLLLDAGGTASSVYGLWHMSVEELGKGEILANVTSNAAGQVEIPRAL
jgi:AbiV family abortive infection protein